jgi:hypothetical protein
MTSSASFDPYLEPWLTARVPRLGAYSAQLAEFLDWVRTEVDAQANCTDRYAPPARGSSRAGSEPKMTRRVEACWSCCWTSRSCGPRTRRSSESA